MRSARVFISAGEVSGDVVGARLTRQIRHQSPDVAIFGIGGERMRGAGATIDIDANHLGVVGISEVVVMVPSLLHAWRRVRQRVHDAAPDVAVLIGNDVFNVLLARWLRARQIPTIAYFPPQVWVWRSLAGPIGRSFDLLLTSFPEEQAVYERARGAAAVRFVGHYLSDVLGEGAAVPARLEARRRLEVPERARVVALLPGSRQHEIRALAPAMLDAASRLLEQDPDIHVLLPAAEARFKSDLEQEVGRSRLTGRIGIVINDSYTVISAADLLVVASGTATLEATLLGVPMVIVYKAARLTHAVVRACIRLGLIESWTVGLPNLILRRRAVPELIQSRVTGELIAQEAWSILSDSRRHEEMRQELREAAARVSGKRSIELVAQAVLERASAVVRSNGSEAT